MSLSIANALLFVAKDGNYSTGIWYGYALKESPSTKQVCFIDEFGYEWHLTGQYVGGHPKNYVAEGKVYLGLDKPWNVTATGVFKPGSGTVEMHAINPDPDGCTNYVDSFIYKGSVVYDWKGGVTYSGSGEWTSYCSGSEVSNGTWTASGPCDAGLRADPNGPARARNNFQMVISPNPVKNFTGISYNLQKESQVKITIYNYMRQPVKVLVNGIQSSGPHNYTWDASLLQETHCRTDYIA